VLTTSNPYYPFRRKRISFQAVHATNVTTGS